MKLKYLTIGAVLFGMIAFIIFERHRVQNLNSELLEFRIEYSESLANLAILQVDKDMRNMNKIRDLLGREIDVSYKNGGLQILRTWDFKASPGEDEASIRAALQPCFDHIYFLTVSNRKSRWDWVCETKINVDSTTKQGEVVITISYMENQ